MVTLTEVEKGEDVETLRDNQFDIEVLLSEGGGKIEDIWFFVETFTDDRFDSIEDFESANIFEGFYGVLQGGRGKDCETFVDRVEIHEIDGKFYIEGDGQ